MASFLDLIAAPTLSDLQTKLFAFLRLAGMPVVSWHRFSILRHFSETQPRLLVDLWETVREIGKGAYTKTAVDEWLDLIAENFFDDARKASVATEGTITLTDIGGVGPLTVAANALIVANADGTLRYTNTSAATIPLNGSVTVAVRASENGAAYNLGNGTITILVTSIAGVAVANPAGVSGTWITVQGADAETDGELATRLLAKWGTQGSGATDGAYTYTALSASEEIRRVRTYSPQPGSVRVVVAGENGPVSAGALALAVTDVESMRPVGVPDVVTLNATVYGATISGTITVDAGNDPDAALAEGASNVAAYARSLRIGQRVSREKIIQAIVSPTGVSDCNLVTPATDITLGDNDVFVPTFSVTAVLA